MMPADSDRARRSPAPELPSPAQDPRPFAAIREDLVRVAAAGAIGAMRGQIARAVRRLAEEAHAAARAEALTPAAVADWLEGHVLRERPAEAMTPEQLHAAGAVIDMLRSAP